MTDSTPDTRVVTPVIGISIGDVCGIGLEITLRSMQRSSERFTLIGPGNLIERQAERMAMPADRFRIEDTGTLDESLLHSGKIAPEAGAASHRAVERGAAMALAGEIDALVTAPISKAAWAAAGFTDPGHTELIGAICGAVPVMGFVGEEITGAPLRLALVSIHDPIAALPSVITKESIVETVSIAHRDLAARFGIEKPKIAVAGLNPHAGERGTIGREEIELIEPSIAELKNRGIDVDGPIPGDALFSPRVRRRYDFLVAMYHDQGLGAFKALCSGTGVNVTMGLPIVRTSPDHGTAFEIAGKGVADPSSMLSAISLAARLVSPKPRA